MEACADPSRRTNATLKHHSFRNPDTGKWGANHLLKDCRKACKIYQAMQQIITPVQALSAAPQLVIQAAPANNNTTQAAGTFPQQQPQHEVQTAAHDAYPTARGQLNMIQKGRPSNRVQKLITRQVLQATACPRAVPERVRDTDHILQSRAPIRCTSTRARCPSC